MKHFDSKTFNSEVFLKYLRRIPDTKKNELLKSGVLIPNPDLVASLNEQVGGNFVVRPFKGLINGNAVNYDGKTDITASNSTTYKQGMVVIGRAAGFTEKDFSFEVTGVDFMSNVAEQLAKFWENLDQGTLISILKGIFGVTDFAKSHIYDTKGVIEATTINTAVQKACGDMKNAFSVAIMHSVVATQLENLKILEYAKYTDQNGIERPTALASVNGKLVLIDDSMPISIVEAVYAKTTDTELDSTKTYYTRSGSAGSYEYTPVASPVVGSIGSYYEKTSDGYTEYTTFILGAGAFEYSDVGVKVPVEMDRDPKVNGGEDTLYSRQRKVFAPAGFSFDITKIASDSPTDAELESSANWTLVTDASGSKTYPVKAIPICAVKSRA